MYIRAHCPVCGTDAYHGIKLNALEHLNFDGIEQACMYTIENIEITDTLTEDEIIRDVLQSLCNVIYDGIDINILAGYLKENYGITGVCCRGLIERIMLELCMYCPDRERLYFVKS